MPDKKQSELMSVILDGAKNLTDDQKGQLKGDLQKFMAGFDDQLAKENSKNQALLQATRPKVKVEVANTMIGHLSEANTIPSQHLYSLGAEAAKTIENYLKQNKSIADKRVQVRFDQATNSGSVSLTDANKPRRP